jgi:hypothetical protein
LVTLYRLASICALATSACAHGSRGISSELSDVAESIRRLDGQRAAAYIRRDSVALDRLWADDYVRTTTRALVRNKADIIQFYLHRSPTYDTVFTRDLVIRRYGMVAVAHGIIEYRYKNTAGAATVERDRYLDVWAFRDGRWQVVATQATLVPPDSSR